LEGSRLSDCETKLSALFESFDEYNL